MKKTPIHVIKKMFEQNEMNEKLLNELRMDQRKGVQRLVNLYEKHVEKKRQLENDFHHKRMFDFQFSTNPLDLIAGVDEAGRGPLAGPLVACAVILPKEFTCIGLNDSKQITERERERYFDIITEQAIDYSISILQNNEIDRLNIYEATKKAMADALNRLSPPPNIALIDAVHLGPMSFPTKSIMKGDEKSIAIAAASIIAKVTRDNIMNEIDKQFPMYDFCNNKGYGTKKHLEALKTFGPSIFHRKSYTPVQKAIKK